MVKIAHKSHNNPEISIIIPAYSEEKRIGKTLDELAAFLKDEIFFRKKSVEVIVVVADSLDNTNRIVESKSKLFKKLILLQPGIKVGKGRDVKYGMQRASGKYVSYMDADLATPLHHIVKFYKDCMDGNDIVVGTRDLTKHHPNLLRRSISIIGNILFRITGGVWIEDSQCGFKMFSSKASEICFSRLTILGWGFDMELLTIAKIHKLSMKSVRIDDWVDKPHSKLNNNLLHISARSLFELILILRNRIRHNYI